MTAINSLNFWECVCVSCMYFGVEIEKKMSSESTLNYYLVASAQKRRNGQCGHVMVCSGLAAPLRPSYAYLTSEAAACCGRCLQLTPYYRIPRPCLKTIQIIITAATQGACIATKDQCYTEQLGI